MIVFFKWKSPMEWYILLEKVFYTDLISIPAIKHCHGILIKYSLWQKAATMILTDITNIN